MSVGVGRHKELNLDEIVARCRYVEQKVAGAIENPEARFIYSVEVVIADCLHDIEKKLALLHHAIVSRP